jgi:SAM-dependent methyltransferase
MSRRRTFDTLTNDLLESAVCFRCGGTGTRIHDLDPLGVVRCPTCGQVFTSPRLNDDGRRTLYNDADYFDDGIYGTSGSDRMQRIWIAGRLDLIERHISGRRLLEFGCAYGWVLNSARDRGFTVEGMEFSAVAATAASERLKVPIHQSYDINGTFDVVTAWDVIEHVPNPTNLLHSARRLLTPEGLLVLSCPYYDSIPARVSGSHWRAFKPLEHIWHFTRAGMRRTLSESGFTPIDVVDSPFRRANLMRFDSMVVVAGVTRQVPNEPEHRQV